MDDIATTTSAAASSSSAAAVVPNEVLSTSDNDSHSTEHLDEAHLDLDDESSDIEDEVLLTLTQANCDILNIVKSEDTLNHQHPATKYEV